MPTKQDYVMAFERERIQTHPVVDDYENRVGYRVDLNKLENAARVLACPVKVNPPNWQHGRILYAAARRYLANCPSIDVVKLLDIGTAKGFSALCLQWALADSGKAGAITSVDVIDPSARVLRNTIAEVGAAPTLFDILQPWPEIHNYVQFLQSTGVDWLRQNENRIHFAFVDGKHDYRTVSVEAGLLARHQKTGDMIVFDDVQILGIRDAVESLRSGYEIEFIEILLNRAYAVAVHR